jgi:hypothetical protein
MRLFTYAGEEVQVAGHDNHRHGMQLPIHLLLQVVRTGGSQPWTFQLDQHIRPRVLDNRLQLDAYSRELRCNAPGRILKGKRNVRYNSI